MAKHPSEILASMIGQLHLQLAAVTAQRDEALERLQALEAERRHAPIAGSDAPQ